MKHTHACPPTPLRKHDSMLNTGVQYALHTRGPLTSIALATTHCTHHQHIHTLHATLRHRTEAAPGGAGVAGGVEAGGVEEDEEVGVGEDYVWWLLRRAS